MKKILYEDAKKIVSLLFGEEEKLPDGLTFEDFLRIKETINDDLKNIAEAQIERKTILEKILSLF